MAVLPAWADFGRRLGADNAADAEMTLSLIRDYVRGFFDRFLLGSASSLVDRAPGKYGISISSRTKLGAKQRLSAPDRAASLHRQTGLAATRLSARASRRSRTPQARTRTSPRQRPYRPSPAVRLPAPAWSHCLRPRH